MCSILIVHLRYHRIFEIWSLVLSEMVRVDKSSGFVKHWYKSISGEVPAETDVVFELLDRLNNVIH